MNEEEARKLIQEAMKDHPRPNFFTGKRQSGNCPNARDAIRMLRENAEEENDRQMKIHADGNIW